MITDKEFTDIMERLNGPAFPQIYGIAERYVKRKLPEQYTPSIKTELGIDLCPTQIIVTQTFLRACKDFLIRASRELAEKYRADAETLEASLRVIRQDDRRYFDSLTFRGADRAVLALETMASRFREIADDYDKDPNNITFFYDIGRIFGQDKLPSAGEANAVYVILIETLRSLAPHRLAGIRKTDYDSNSDGRQIRDLMKTGAMSALTQEVSG